jgi:hypothetical protein
LKNRIYSHWSGCQCNRDYVRNRVVDKRFYFFSFLRVLNFAHMQNADNHRWRNLTGGYRMALDPRPLVAKLEAGQGTESTWHELWNELHHQGDVGDASYAAVPLLVDVYRKQRVIDWNTYAMVATIELARTKGHNPELPEWLKADYFQAIRQLGEIGVAEVFRADEAETVRAILSVIAIAKGLRTHARFLVEYTEDELLEIDPLY